jgi:hypothetical protein
MGCAPSSPRQKKDDALLAYVKASYQKEFTHPSAHPALEITSATYTDLAAGLGEWGMSNKDSQHLKTVLRAYISRYTCIDKYVVIIYKNQAWMFKTVYNDEIEHYRVITILPPRA